MPSRTARLICTVAVWIALGAAAFFIVQSEKEISLRASAFRAFDQHAREAAMSLGDARAAQQAYVAAGQDNAFWMPKVGSTAEQTMAAVTELRAAAADPSTRADLDQAANTIAMFADIDKRAREYVKSEQTLMAADVIFTEGGEAAATAARSIEAARIAERQAANAADATTRQREAMALGGAGGFAALMVLLLAITGATKGSTLETTAAADSTRGPRDTAASSDRTLDLDDWAGPARPAATSRPAAAAPTLAPPPSPQVVAEAPTPAAEVPLPSPSPEATTAQPQAGASAAQTMIKAAADLSTEFGRVRDMDDLKRVLGRSAEAMEATGLLVWMGSISGDDLRPLLAHGYNDQTLARIAPVARTDSNAAAAAYRSGQLQIVVSKPGANGALVAPILVPGGCIGALSAEFRGAETSETVQAFTTIVAGQLATVLGSEPADNVDAKIAHA
jgi:hypothetical protein